MKRKEKKKGEKEERRREGEGAPAKGGGHRSGHGPSPAPATTRGGRKRVVEQCCMVVAEAWGAGGGCKWVSGSRSNLGARVSVVSLGLRYWAVGFKMYLAARLSQNPPNNSQNLPPKYALFPLPATRRHPSPAVTSGSNQDAISSLHGLVQRLHYNSYNPIDPSGAPRDTPRAQQGLSLTLSSQHQPGNYGSQPQAVSGNSASSGSAVTNGVSGIQSVLLSSKYLRAAQELLDKVVNVDNTGFTKTEMAKKAVEMIAIAVRLPENCRQRKETVLVARTLLVDHRYRQYHHQMQIVISTFEQTAGIGSAKTYTALVLKTISKQFRCLKDAIIGQIRAVNKIHFQGLSAGLLRQATYTTARLGSFKMLTSKAIEANDGKPLPLYQKALCGLTAGAIGACFGSPADLALIRMQADATLPAAQRRNYTNAFHALYRIVADTMHYC
ncbi:hypothetical protein CXB51_017885 [Gossypium anomalum]|uniref:POX domain-containing protein n=1 Tax=Gossypium anomalum TaxID=47600 RepID=A0A8J6D1A6_9ROSI|nr:hypothetical protein CXB51_017885 [Gossypium anomalum]